MREADSSAKPMRLIERAANGASIPVGLVECASDDQFNHSFGQTVGQLLVDEPLGLKHLEESLVGERLGERRVRYQLPTAHVIGEKDCDPVEEQEQGLDPRTLAGQPVRLGVVVGQLAELVGRRRLHAVSLAHAPGPPPDCFESRAWPIARFRPGGKSRGPGASSGAIQKCQWS